MDISLIVREYYMNDTKFEQINKTFNSIKWHDSELLGLRIRNDANQRTFDIELEVNVITELRGIFSFTKLRFIDARAINLDLDLLGVSMCSGHISGSICYRDAVAIESELRNRRGEFGLPEDSLPFDDTVAFLIEMIHPGGDLLIFARDLQIES
jgi:hypothetical protein